ncbi:alpha-crystallin domain-containing protein 22.3 isoform X6 [Capsicum annuum]|uniref:alpha-crystallin domain-containing protein 22.3 isoform X6 n=1 Tax=Capsicum annuum TaxID=4072 RepID=UPI001FB169D9|nr:alpha-crystallin domain-containing protein 22.3 isoform X6 [Capsicum annuum]
MSLTWINVSLHFALDKSGFEQALSCTFFSNVSFIASQSSLSNYGETNGSIPLHPQPLNVAPISCVPYTGPPLPYGYHADSVLVKVSRTSSSKHINSQQHAGGQPKMVFFPACPAREEWGNLINHANGGVALTGSALLGKVGPLLGLVDIAESEDAYVFRFSLPGVAKDEKVFHCDAGSNGKIIIKGVSMTGESKVCWKNMVFKMHTQNLCPPDGREKPNLEDQ